MTDDLRIVIEPCRQDGGVFPVWTSAEPLEKPLGRFSWFFAGRKKSRKSLLASLLKVVARLGIEPRTRGFSAGFR